MGPVTPAAVPGSRRLGSRGKTAADESQFVKTIKVSSLDSRRTPEFSHPRSAVREKRVRRNRTARPLQTPRYFRGPAQLMELSSPGRCGDGGGTFQRKETHRLQPGERPASSVLQLVSMFVKDAQRDSLSAAGFRSNGLVAVPVSAGRRQHLQPRRDRLRPVSLGNG
ncbi:hypothetical protein SKAU_G00350920 [Synaphobranchus kaupii]|uniref:Uncharacterized protein n=1 Tax=Synaphobranchus kaupii TaxID=118154 RepID=A0A9Q1EKC6_SYNKA|nr:hypothetical protein SKAU_G00350920 [Synaphobranchus kaupii]